MRERLGERPAPLRYVLTATGNVYEDVVHAKAVAEAGGDIVAVIRSTAQSLLDYVPYGPTTEGYGGTFATQANFRIMREAMDEWSEQHGRYVRLSSFCSGLCMSEIAAMGAWEGFDNMVNDALYGILYRDINIVRGLIDQRISRMINGYFGVVINTGEDNYLRTADAIEAAPSVTASQFINHQLARDSGVPDAQIGLGDAFEIDVPVKNGLLYEWAQAQLTRELFPDCPVKYMPPTRHMDGNLFRTHAADTLFNLVTIATCQGIQTIGVPTEGIFTPHIHDRVLGLQNVDYVFNAAHDLGEEIEFKRGGIIQTRAQEVLAGAHALLERIAETGLFKAIEQATFGDVSRAIDGGRGIEGIVETEPGYFNPLVELMREASRHGGHGRAMPEQADLAAVQPLRRPHRRRARADELHAARPLLARRPPGGARAGREDGLRGARGRPLRAAHRGLHVFRDVRALRPERRLRRAPGGGLRHRVHERGRGRALRRRAPRPQDRRRRREHRLGHPQRRDRRDAQPEGLPRPPRPRGLPRLRDPQPRQPGAQQRAARARRSRSAPTRSSSPRPSPSRTSTSTTSPSSSRWSRRRAGAGS